MGLVRTWSQQVVRAAGASLIAPLALLVTAGAVASGGGLGGLGSLGQLASGPSLPDTGVATAPRSSIKRAQIVGADVPSSGETAASAPPAGQLASAAPVSPPPATASPRAETERVTPRERRRRRSPLLDTGEGVRIGEPGPIPPPAGGDPVDGLEETTRGLGESLSEPLRPVTNQLLDLLRLLAPPRR